MVQPKKGAQRSYYYKLAARRPRIGPFSKGDFCRFKRIQQRHKGRHQHPVSLRTLLEVPPTKWCSLVYYVISRLDAMLLQTQSQTKLTSSFTYSVYRCLILCDCKRALIKTADNANMTATGLDKHA